MKTFTCIQKTALGEIGICEKDGAIIRLYFPGDEAEGEICSSPLLDEAFKQLHEYFAGLRTEFDLPLNPEGTPFQRSVWNALLEIPYGETVSYKYIAERIGNPKAVRAVGMANNRNPISIFIPCHRVIGMNGKLVGYSAGLNIKSALLNLEQGFSCFSLQ